MKKGLLVVISGPSGAGKGTIYKMITPKLPDIFQSISVTTRAPRPNEIPDVTYYYRTDEEFEKMRERGEFLETAKVYDHYYGTPAAPVFNAIDNGQDVIFEIDVQGAKNVKKLYPDSVLIFIMPPSFEILESRLRNRNTEKAESLELRIKSARDELAQYNHFDYFVVNDVADVAASEVLEIIKAEKCVIKRNVDFIENLLKK